MKAIILAAGRGSRMQHLTAEQPKCLVEMNDKTLLDWQLDALYEAGFQKDDIAIVTGYKSNELTTRGLHSFHNPDWANTNMVSSLAHATSWLEKYDCIISYSDIFYVSNAINLLQQAKAELAITYDPNWITIWKKRFEDPLTDAETFLLNPDSTLKEIGNKPKNLDEIEGQYMGLIRLTPTAWQKIQAIRTTMPEAEKNQLHMTGLLQKIISTKTTPIRAIPYTGVWGEVDSQTDLLAYQ